MMESCKSGDFKESYYSSDEEIAWGAITMKEIKKDLESEPTKNEKRHTDFGYYTFYTPSASMHEMNSETNNTGTSIYVTPDDSINPEPNLNKNDVFLEKLAKAIDSETETSSYRTAAENSKCDTLLNMLNTHDRQEDELYLDKARLTLMENTIQSSPMQDRLVVIDSSIEEISDEESFTDGNVNEAEVILISDDSSNCLESEAAYSNDYEHANSLIKIEDASLCSKNSEFDYNCSKESVSTDSMRGKDNLYFEKRDRNNEDVSPLKREEQNLLYNSIDEDSGETSEKRDNSIANEEQNLSNNSINEESVETSEKRDNSVANIYEEISYEEIPYENNENYATYLNTSKEFELEENTERIKLMHLNDEINNISGIEFCDPSTRNEAITDMSLRNSFTSEPASFGLPNVAPSVARELESSKNDSLVFNDTLEEMEMFMKQGFDYNFPGDNCTTSQTTPVPQKSHLPIPLSSKKKTLKTPNKFDYIQSPVGDYIRKKTSCHDNFKMPLKPVKGKMTPNTKSPLASAKQFNNIISPIAIYIKDNTPVCKQNVRLKTVSSLKFQACKTSESNNLENNAEISLPPAVYKPAKRVVTSTQEDIVLPSSVQKLVEVNCVVTQHEKRIMDGRPSKSGITEKLLEEDLTTVDSSLLDEAGDVSFLNVKRAFIK